MKDPGRYTQTRSGDKAGTGRDGFNRRDFLRGSGAAAAATALTGQIAEAVGTSSAAAIEGPSPVSITLSINGERKQLSLEPRVTLLDALRNQLDTTGAKRVCDRGTCGACTVILDGNPVYACSVLAIDAQNKPIRTIESLGKDHPMVQAFGDNDAQQCGFCTPGFVMACTAFAESHDNPTLEDVEHGLCGNLCRCGTYMGIKGAVLQAAKTMKGGGR